MAEIAGDTYRPSQEALLAGPILANDPFANLLVSKSIKLAGIMVNLENRAHLG